MLKPHRLVAPLLAVALAASLATATSRPAGAATQAPTWGPVTTLATGLQHAGNGLDVTVDPAGNTTVVWGTSWYRGPIMAVRRPAAGAWGKPVRIGVGTDPQVASDAAGNLTAIWQTNQPGVTTGVAAARRPTKGPWGPPKKLTTDSPAPGYGWEAQEGVYGAQSLHLAVNARGAAIAVWTWGSYDRNAPYRVRAAYRPVGKGWNGTAALTPANDSERAQAGIDGNGNVVLGYFHAGTTYGMRRVLGHGWTSPVRVAPGELSDLAVAPDGAAVLVISDVPKAVYRPAGGPWGKPTRLSTMSVNAVFFPSVVMDGAGTATAFWAEKTGGKAARRPPSGPWGAPVRIAAAETTPAVNARGDILATWAGRGLQGRYRRSSGPWGPSFRITRGTPWLDAFATAVYRFGDAVAVWETGGTLLVRRMSR